MPTRSRTAVAAQPNLQADPVFDTNRLGNHLALQLKIYQEKTLETLEAHGEKVAEIGDAKKAFVDTVYARSTKCVTTRKCPA